MLIMRKSILLVVAVMLGFAFPVRAQEKEPEIITRLEKAKVEGPFTLVVIVKVKEGEEKTLLNAARPCIASTRKEKGCLHYELLHDLENPQQFIFHERWKSVQALSDHFLTEHFKKLVGNMASILDGAPRFAVLRTTSKE
jgi:quinol monooxygenase YgiN